MLQALEHVESAVVDGCELALSGADEVFACVRDGRASHATPDAVFRRISCAGARERFPNLYRRNRQHQIDAIVDSHRSPLLGLAAFPIAYVSQQRGGVAFIEVFLSSDERGGRVIPQTIMRKLITAGVAVASEIARYRWDVVPAVPLKRGHQSYDMALFVACASRLVNRSVDRNLAFSGEANGSGWDCAGDIDLKVLGLQRECPLIDKLYLHGDTIVEEVTRDAAPQCIPVALTTPAEYRSFLVKLGLVAESRPLPPPVAPQQRRLLPRNVSRAVLVLLAAALAIVPADVAVVPTDPVVDTPAGRGGILIIPRAEAPMFEEATVPAVFDRGELDQARRFPLPVGIATMFDIGIVTPGPSVTWADRVALGAIEPLNSPLPVDVERDIEENGVTLGWFCGIRIPGSNQWAAYRSLDETRSRHVLRVGMDAWRYGLMGSFASDLYHGCEWVAACDVDRCWLRPDRTPELEGLPSLPPEIGRSSEPSERYAVGAAFRPSGLGLAIIAVVLIDLEDHRAAVELACTQRLERGDLVVAFPESASDVATWWTSALALRRDIADCGSVARPSQGRRKAVKFVLATGDL